MNKTAIFYGSSTGNTESVANTIATKLNADIYNVADYPIENIPDYNNLIFGSSTWGIGDLQVLNPFPSGTCRKRCKPTHNPNLQQEPSSPSHQSK